MSDKTVKQCDHCPCDRAFQAHHRIVVKGDESSPDINLDACSTTCALALTGRLTSEGKTVTIWRVRT